MWELFSQWHELSGDTQYAGVNWKKSGLGSGHATTRARPRTISNIWITICFTINVISKLFCYKHLILVFLFCFSVALAQNTTGITTATTMAAAGRNSPLVPHMRPCAPRWCVKWMGDNPPSLRMYFWGGWGCLWPSKRFWRWCIATTLECIKGHAHPNSPKNYVCLLGGLSPIHSTRRHGAEGLMWGAREPFPLAAAMVGYGCDGWCWPLEAYVRSINCRNSRNCLRKYFFYSYVDPIHSWHLTWQLKKKDLDLRTLLFSWFLCPVFYGS